MLVDPAQPARLHHPARGSPPLDALDAVVLQRRGPYAAGEDPELHEDLSRELHAEDHAVAVVEPRDVRCEDDWRDGDVVRQVNGVDHLLVDLVWEVRQLDLDLGSRLLRELAE